MEGNEGKGKKKKSFLLLALQLAPTNKHKGKEGREKKRELCPSTISLSSSTYASPPRVEDGELGRKKGKKKRLAFIFLDPSNRLYFADPYCDCERL